MTIEDREHIVRLNIERFERLLTSEDDPEKRRLLGSLLSEAQAELELLVELGRLEAERGTGPVSQARRQHLHRKAGECREVARTHENSSTRETFLLFAERYEAALAESTAPERPGNKGG